MDLEVTTFGGHPVFRRFVHGKPYFKCKKVIGSLDQLKDWNSNHKSQNFREFLFGEEKIELNPLTNMIKIACLEEDYFSFKFKVSNLIHENNRR